MPHMVMQSQHHMRASALAASLTSCLNGQPKDKLQTDFVRLQQQSLPFLSHTPVDRRQHPAVCARKSQCSSPVRMKRRMPLFSIDVSGSDGMLRPRLMVMRKKSSTMPTDSAAMFMTA